MQRPLPLKNGWYRVPGDGKDDLVDGKKLNPEERNLRVFSLRAFFWAYVQNGAPVALSSKADKNSDPNGSTKVTIHNRAHAVAYEAFWGCLLWDLMTIEYALLGGACRWNGKDTGFVGDADLLAKAPHEHTSILAEQVLISNVVETGRRELKYTLRSWPYCPNAPAGSGVDLCPILDRDIGSVSLKFHCACGQ